MSGLTIDNPVTLASAFASIYVIPGDTVLLRDGTYSSNYVSLLDGISLSPVTLRPYQAERPIINGYLAIQGSYVVFRDLEICYLDWTTRQTDTPATQTLNARAPYCKFINCIVHDLYSPFVGQESIGAEFYGCVLYHNGWLGTDRGHGHALYCQNSNAAQMTIKDCIMFDNFGWGLHAYAGNGARLYNISMEGNTSFRAGSLAGVPRPNFLLGADSVVSDACTIKDNMSYGGSVGLQFYKIGANLAELSGNYMPDGKQGTYTALSESGNYWGAAIGNQVFIRANEYDANRANLTIYNEAAADAVNVDVSALFGATGTVKAYNAQGYFTDIQTLTITAGVITVNMQAANRTVTTPVQWTAPAKTFPAFGCFVLVKQ